MLRGLLIMTILANHSSANTTAAIGLLTALLIGAASLYTPMANAAPIYKVVDAKTGQVTFTDRPQSYNQAGNQISQTSVTTGNNSSSNGNQSNSSQSANNQSANSAQVPAQPSAANVNYQLTITEPSDERAYRRPAQSIDVKVQLQPALQAGDSVSIYLDGNEVARGLSASIATVDLLPGEHNVQAVVRNVDGKVLQQVSRTVYVIQNNVTLHNNKKIAEQLLAYQNLPWHQKVLYKMRQKNAE